MPITVTPTPTVLGPGLQLQFSTGLPQPPQLTNWQIYLNTLIEATEGFHLVSSSFVEGQPLKIRLSVPQTTAQFNLAWPSFQVKENDPVHLFAKVVTAPSQVLEEIRIGPLPWVTTMTSDLQFAYWDNLRALISGQGTTSSDKLDRIVAAVYRTWPGA